MSRPDRPPHAGTRERLLHLLRGQPQTAEDLATSLEITPTAVRGHLARLSRDGLVRAAGVRRGRGKPPVLYELTPSAERMFPVAHEQALSAILDGLRHALTPDELRRVLRIAGRRMAEGVADGNQPASAAVELINDLGGVAHLERKGREVLIQGARCPLGRLATAYPEACKMLEALVAEVTGARVTERCVRDDPPKCTLRIQPRVAAG